MHIPEKGAEGVLLCQGTGAGGYSLFVKDGTLQYVHNYVGRELFHVEADTAVSEGDHDLRSNSSRPASRTQPTATAHRDASSCTSTASS